MGYIESGLIVVIVGVIGVVGQEFLDVLMDWDFFYRDIKMLVSKWFVGQKMFFEGKEYVIEEFMEESFKGVEIVLFSVGGLISKKYGLLVVVQGMIVVDNSFVF